MKNMFVFEIFSQIFLILITILPVFSLTHILFSLFLVRKIKKHSINDKQEIQVVYVFVTYRNVT